MKVSKRIQISASLNPTKDTTTKSVASLIKMIHSNQLLLPVFQTDVRWNLNHSKELLNYMLHAKAPVAAISFNKISQINPQIQQVKLVSREMLSITSLAQDTYNIIDGQQRLSCIFKSATDHEEFKDIVLDTKKGDFIIKDANKEETSDQIPVGVLYNEDAKVLTKYINEKQISFEATTDLIQIRSKFLNYNFSINCANDLSLDEQIEWFTVLNLAGSKLPEIQMKLTALQVHGIDFHTDYARKYIEKINNFYSNIVEKKTTEVSIPVAALNAAYLGVTGEKSKKNYSPIPSDQKVKKICELQKNDLKKCISATLESLDEALELLRNNIDSDKINRIEQITYIQGIITNFKFKNIFLSPERKKTLLKWVEGSQFNNTSNGQRRDIYNDLKKLFLIN